MISNVHIGEKFSLRFFMTIIILAFFVLVALVLYDFKAERAIVILKERYSQVEKLRGDIIHYNEVMTMSARMAATTSDLKWVNRYISYEPQLTNIIKRTIELSPEIYRHEADRNNISKITLFDMEHKALDLIRQGDNKAAMEIMFSDAYEAQGKKYVQAVERLSAFLKKQMEAALDVEKSKEDLARVSLMSVLIMLLLSWLVILRITRRFQETLMTTNLTLKNRSDQLDDLNRTLDLKVGERTKSLEEALEQLQKTNNDLKETQNQLLQSEKFSAIGQLAAGMAHEINNPIGFINNNIQTMQKYVDRFVMVVTRLEALEKAIVSKDETKTAELLKEWQESKESINYIFMAKDSSDLLKESREGIEKIKKIVFNLRAFSSPDRGTMGSINLEVLFDSMLNLVWNEIKYKVELRRDYKNVESVVCNPQEISQVFVNLMLNAAQSIKERGIITIKTYMKDDFVCFDVMDNGCGISPEHARQIFDPFFTTKPVGRAMGLGLSISYDIIRKHMGQITFKTKLGEGTTFTVMMPKQEKI